jgi:hypothetical protein
MRSVRRASDYVQTPKPPKSKLLSAVLMRWMVSLLRYKNDKDRVLRK